MDYLEFSKFQEILENKPWWKFPKYGIDEKLEYINKMKPNFVPRDIYLLYNLLKNKNDNIRLSIAEIIISLYQRLNSKSELSECLKFLTISFSDLDYFKSNLPEEKYIHLLCIASLNCSGYIREQSIIELTATKSPYAIKFIILRLIDWVDKVRYTAQECLKLFFLKENFLEFVRNLTLIEWMLKVERNDIIKFNTIIIEYLSNFELSDEILNVLHSVKEKSKCLYYRYYFENVGINKRVLDFVLREKSPTLKYYTLKYINQVDQETKRTFLEYCLKVKLSKVKVKALEIIEEDIEGFYENILALTSDKSCSVRYTARYLLRKKNINFRELYRFRISKNKQIEGSILGLVETGNELDLTYFMEYINYTSSKVKFACLKAIEKFSFKDSLKLSWDLLFQSKNKFKLKCIEIISKNTSKEDFNKLVEIFKSGNIEQKKTILAIYDKVGGWKVLPELIMIFNDENLEIQNLGWKLLSKWKMKAVSLYTSPEIEVIEKAKFYYYQIKVNYDNIPFSVGELWRNLPFFFKH